METYVSWYQNVKLSWILLQQMMKVALALWQWW